MKRKPVKKHSSVTEFIRRNKEGVTKAMTIRERHENTKEKLNQLVQKARNTPSLNEGEANGSVSNGTPTHRERLKHNHEDGKTDIAHDSSSMLLLPDKSCK